MWIAQLLQASAAKAPEMETGEHGQNFEQFSFGFFRVALLFVYSSLSFGFTKAFQFPSGCSFSVSFRSSASCIKRMLTHITNCVLLSSCDA
jgi:hypothetical protein